MDRAGHRGRHDLTGRDPQAGDVPAPTMRLPRTRRMLAILLAVALLGGIALLVTTTTGSSNGPPFTGATTRLRGGPAEGLAATGITKIKHIVVIMQENRSFDSYFGTFPGADGFPTDADGNISVCVPDPSTAAASRPYHDRRDVNGGGPHGHVDAVGDINGGAMDGFVDRFENAIRLGNTGCKDPNAAGLHRGQPARRHGLPRRPRDPELLGVREELRPAGPHVPAGHLVEPAGAPVHRLGLVGRLRGRGPRPPAATRTPGPATRDRSTRSTRGMAAARRCTRGPTSPTCCTARTSRGATTSSTGHEPDCRNDALITCPPRSPVPSDARDLEPAPLLHHRPGQRQLGNITSVEHYLSAATHGHLPAVSWVVPSEAVSEHPTARVSDGQSYVTGLGQRRDARPGLELDRHLPDLGRLGRLLRPRRAARRRRERLRAAGARHRDQPVRAAGVTSTTRR